MFCQVGSCAGEFKEGVVGGRIHGRGGEGRGLGVGGEDKWNRYTGLCSQGLFGSLASFQIDP